MTCYAKRWLVGHGYYYKMIILIWNTYMLATTTGVYFYRLEEKMYLGACILMFFDKLVPYIWDTEPQRDLRFNRYVSLPPIGWFLCAYTEPDFHKKSKKEYPYREIEYSFPCQPLITENTARSIMAYELALLFTTLDDRAVELFVIFIFVPYLSPISGKKPCILIQRYVVLNVIWQILHIVCYKHDLAIHLLIIVILIGAYMHYLNYMRYAQSIIQHVENQEQLLAEELHEYRGIILIMEGVLSPHEVKKSDHKQDLYGFVRYWKGCMWMILSHYETVLNRTQHLEDKPSCMNITKEIMTNFFKIAGEGYISYMNPSIKLMVDMDLPSEEEVKKKEKGYCYSGSYLMIRALWNILSNSIKASNKKITVKGKLIEVKDIPTYKNENKEDFLISENQYNHRIYKKRDVCHWLRVSIKDTGPGMNQQILQKLRSNVSFTYYEGKKKTALSSGLGTSIVHTALKKQYGLLSYQPSDESPGSILTIYFPLTIRTTYKNCQYQEHYHENSFIDLAFPGFYDRITTF